ncbi:hypothetical protein [Salimicrobium flavidum]|uniref:Resolvase HTH domain-containing protein n=1 Tax=Salimicrobium flavidum TaxID=570947 RepID=A0A1N7IIJ7_9BACI|nr:hypothetical protein [Salimicrobium flavidum]SIS36882.1 hypothetical protein SAMN05421687_101117 [Salimicrobium flavidum]
MIETVLMCLIGISVVLFLLSFLTSNSFKKLEEEIEQNQLQSMQEMYTLKKKVQVLEEELLHKPELEPSTFSPSLPQKVTQLKQNGYSVREISQMTQVNEHDVYRLMHQQNEKGGFL